MRLPPIGVECPDDPVDIAGSNASGVGVAAVGDQLKIGWPAAEKVAPEIRADLDDEKGAAVVDHPSYVLGPDQVGHAPEHLRPIEPRHEFLRRCAPVLIE